MPTEEEWRVIGERLRAPFPVEKVEFRVQGRANEQTGRGQVVAYIDARAVQDRLDDVVGAGNWAFDWTPLVVDKGEVQVAKGTLTIHGVSKSDAGTASNFEATLGAVSHCFKRAAVHWGVGRYLYDVDSAWVQVEKGGRIPENVLSGLRGRLPRPGQRPAAGPAPIAAPVEAAPAPPPAARPANPLDRRTFISEIGELGLNTTQAMAQLGVRTLDGLDLDAALAELRRRARQEASA